MRTKQDTREIVELFKKEYPLAECLSLIHI